jgi:hypothetical protein
MILVTCIRKTYKIFDKHLKLYEKYLKILLTALNLLILRKNWDPTQFFFTRSSEKFPGFQSAELRYNYVKPEIHASALFKKITEFWGSFSMFRDHLPEAYHSKYYRTSLKRNGFKNITRTNEIISCNFVTSFQIYNWNFRFFFVELR